MMSDVKLIGKTSPSFFSSSFPPPENIITRVNQLFATHLCSLKDLKEALQPILPEKATLPPCCEKYPQLIFLIEKVPNSHLNALISLYPTSYQEHLLQHCPPLLLEKIVNNFSSFQQVDAKVRLEFLLKLDKEEASLSLADLPLFRLKELHEECLEYIKSENTSFPSFPKSIQLAPSFPPLFINSHYEYIFSSAYEGFFDLEDCEEISNELYFLFATPLFLEKLAVILATQENRAFGFLISKLAPYFSADFYSHFFPHAPAAFTFSFFLYLNPSSASSTKDALCHLSQALLKTLSLEQKSILCNELAKKEKISLLQRVLDSLPKDQLPIICNLLPHTVWEIVFPSIDTHKQQEVLKDLVEWMQDDLFNIENCICKETPFNGFIYLKSLTDPAKIHSIIKTLDETSPSDLQVKACKRLWLLHLPSDIWLNLIKKYSDGFFDSAFLLELMIQRQLSLSGMGEDEKLKLASHLMECYQNLNEQLIEQCLITKDLKSKIELLPTSEVQCREILEKKALLAPQTRRFYLYKSFLKLCKELLKQGFFEEKSKNTSKGPIRKRHKKLPNTSTIDELLKEYEKVLELRKDLFKQLQDKIAPFDTSKSHQDQEWEDIGKDSDKAEKMLQLQKTLLSLGITCHELNEKGIDLDSLITEQCCYLEKHLKEKNIHSKEAFFTVFSPPVN